MDNLNERLMELEGFYEFYKPERVKYFIQKHNNTIDLLEVIEEILTEVFPDSDFELIVSFRSFGEDDNSLLLLVHFDEKTLNESFSDKLSKVFRKILPIKRKLGLSDEFQLVPGFRNSRL